MIPVFFDVASRTIGVCLAFVGIYLVVLRVRVYGDEVRYLWLRSLTSGSAFAYVAVIQFFSGVHIVTSVLAGAALCLDFSHTMIWLKNNASENFADRMSRLLRR